MSKYKIGLDYGHGGSDPGAVANGLKEKDMNYHTGKACREELEKHDVIVYESRTHDQNLTLQQRADIFNASNVDYVVSIHHNAGENIA